MSHVRTQIRDAVANVLNRLPETGFNVFKGRYFSIQAPKLPALLVYTTNEDAELSIMGSSRGSDRVLTLVIEAYAKSSGVVEDALDKIAVEVEEAMAADYTLGGLTRDVRYTGYELDANADPEQTVAVIRLTYDIKYRVSAGDVETAL